MADVQHDQPPLYDVHAALRSVQHSRLAHTAELHQATVNLGDRLAQHMARHFPDGTGDAGTALLVAAGSVGFLAAIPAIPSQVVVNLLAFAGARLLESADRQQTDLS